VTSQGYVINNICLKKILKILEKRFGRSNVFIIWYVEILHHHLIRGNTSDFIDHPLPKHFVSTHGAFHNAWVPGPHRLNKSGAANCSFIFLTASHLCLTMHAGSSRWCNASVHFPFQYCLRTPTNDKLQPVLWFQAFFCVLMFYYWLCHSHTAYS